MSRISIVLADDHLLVREGIRAVLEREPDFRVVGEASDGLEAVRLVEQIRPQLLIVDLKMPGLDGCEVVRQVTQRCLRTKVLVLSMHPEEQYVSDALKNGASGYVLKKASSSELNKAIREVLAGRRYLSPELSDLVLTALLGKGETAAKRDPLETLTSREREVLQLVIEGHHTPAIAKRLFLSPRTVETHRAHFMSKLRLRSYHELLRFAMRRGLLQ